MVSQVRIAPAGVFNTRLTVRLSPPIVLPPASCTVATGWFASATWLVAVVLGWVVKLSLDAGPTVIVKLVLTAEVNDPLVAVNV